MRRSLWVRRCLATSSKGTQCIQPRGHDGPSRNDKGREHQDDNGERWIELTVRAVGNVQIRCECGKTLVSGRGGLCLVVCRCEHPLDPKQGANL